MDELNVSNNLTPRYPTKTITGYWGCDKKECAFSPQVNEWVCLENDYYNTCVGMKTVPCVLMWIVGAAVCVASVSLGYKVYKRIRKEIEGGKK